MVENPSPEYRQQALLAQLRQHSIRDTVSGIQLVPFDGSEVLACLEWFNDKDIRRYNNQLPDTIYSIQNWVSDSFKGIRTVRYRIVHPLYSSAYGFTGHASLNSISSQDMSYRRSITIGAKEHWHQGISTTVGKMILQHTKSLGFLIARAQTYEKNIASVRNLTNSFGKGTRREIPNSNEYFVDFSVDLRNLDKSITAGVNLVYLPAKSVQQDQ